MDARSTTALTEAARQLHRIGSANDAEDHGHADEARRLRAEACSSLRGLLEGDVLPAELVAELRRELDTGHIDGVGWSRLLDRVEALLSLRRPPPGERRWTTPDGCLLREGEPSSTQFVGVPIPGLEEAHAYTLHDPDGRLRESFAPTRQRLAEHAERYWLTLYQVVGDQLLRFEVYCFEESTFDVPDACSPVVTVLIAGLLACHA